MDFTAQGNQGAMASPERHEQACFGGVLVLFLGNFYQSGQPTTEAPWRNQSEPPIVFIDGIRIPNNLNDDHGAQDGKMLTEDKHTCKELQNELALIIKSYLRRSHNVTVSKKIIYLVIQKP